jgi:hypothetical protein
LLTDAKQGGLRKQLAISFLLAHFFFFAVFFFFCKKEKVATVFVFSQRKKVCAEKNRIWATCTSRLF